MFLKRSMRPGFAGIENELLYDARTMLLFGDAGVADQAGRRRQIPLIRLSDDGLVDSGWMEIGPGILVRRAALDQTLGLVIGGDGCLVVDTGRDEVHGAELAAAVR